MPAPMIAKIAKETGKSIEKIEKFWEKAKTIASDKWKESDKAFWPMTTYLTKRMAGMKESEGKTFAEYLHFEMLVEEEAAQIISGYSVAPSIEAKDNILLIKQDQFSANMLRAGLVIKQIVQEDESTLHLELAESTALTEPQIKELFASEVVQFIDAGKETKKIPDFSLFFDVKKEQDDITATKFVVKALKSYKFAVVVNNFNRI
jgi:hypothetical protein